MKSPLDKVFKKQSLEPSVSFDQALRSKLFNEKPMKVRTFSPWIKRGSIVFTCSLVIIGAGMFNFSGKGSQSKQDDKKPVSIAAKLFFEKVSAEENITDIGKTYTYKKFQAIYESRAGIEDCSVKPTGELEVRKPDVMYIYNDGKTSAVFQKMGSVDTDNIIVSKFSEDPEVNADIDSLINQRPLESIFRAGILKTMGGVEVKDDTQLVGNDQGEIKLLFDFRAENAPKSDGTCLPTFSVVTFDPVKYEVKSFINYAGSIAPENITFGTLYTYEKGNGTFDQYEPEMIAEGFNRQGANIVDQAQDWVEISDKQVGYYGRFLKSKLGSAMQDKKMPIDDMYSYRFTKYEDIMFDLFGQKADYDHDGFIKAREAEGWTWEKLDTYSQWSSAIGDFTVSPTIGTNLSTKKKIVLLDYTSPSPIKAAVLQLNQTTYDELRVGKAWNDHDEAPVPFSNFMDLNFGQPGGAAPVFK